MSKTGNITKLHPVTADVALRLIRGVEDYHLAYVSHISGQQGFDEDSGSMTAARTAYDSDDYVETVELFDAIVYSFNNYVADQCKEEVWDYVVNNKRLKDLTYPGETIKEQKNRWLYGFVSNFKGGWLRFLPPDQEKVDYHVPVADEEIQNASQKRFEKRHRQWRH